jgi:hypothetical protein
MPRRGHRGCLRCRTTAASRLTRWAARPGCTPPTGPKPGNGRDFVMAMTGLWRELEAMGAPEPRAAGSAARSVLAWPDGHDEVFEGAVGGARRLADARGSRGIWLSIRSSCRTARRRPSARWIGGRSTRCPTGRGPSKSSSGPALAETWQRAGFGLYLSLAVLHGQVPVLRLQQPCRGGDRRVPLE